MKKNTTQPRKLIVDLFAGGGGVSTGIFLATGIHPDIAINHSEKALSMHRVNHPETRHFIADVFEVCPRGATMGQDVGWLHLSPDCTHHSQAAGGQPRSKRLRGLAWVAHRWAGQVMPDIISLENVIQFKKWGPLIAKRDKKNGRVITLDKVYCPEKNKMVNRIADPGERVPVNNQYLVPDPKRIGRTYRQFEESLKSLGFVIDTRTLCAADYGAPTTRQRFFMLARRDGLAIRWPEQTHYKHPVEGQNQWRVAAECIDFSRPCRSIFGRPKPLAEATMRRIAKGLKKYVLDNGDPFIVQIAHYNGSDPVHSTDKPLHTITAATKGGEFALGLPILAKFRGDSAGASLNEPMPTITSGGQSVRPAGSPHALGVVAPIIVPATHQGSDRVYDITDPMRTITAAHRGEMMVASPVMIQTATNAGSQQQIAAFYLAQLRNNCDGRSAEEPIRTISAGGEHHAAVVAFLSRQFGCSIGQTVEEPTPTIMANGGGKTGVVAAALITNTSDRSATDLRDPALSYPLTPEQEEGALRVAAFLMRYYSEGGQLNGLDEPLSTITTKDRLALVTVTIKGCPHVVVDIGLRMFQPDELFKAQGFPESYEIEHGHDGRKFTKEDQVRMVGNSVPPQLMEAICRANYPFITDEREQFAA